MVADLRKLRSLNQWIFCIIYVFIFVAGQAGASFNFNVFTSNGSYGNSPGADMFADISGGGSQIEFTFFNKNSFRSSIAGIYFDIGPLGEVYSITSSPGTSFAPDFPRPKNLPGGMTLAGPFKSEFSISAAAPPPFNGINSNEWIKLIFDLPAGATPQQIINKIDTGRLRIGIHVIALPDGSSESAILSPEPASLSLIALGGLMLHRRHKTAAKNRHKLPILINF